MLTPQPFSWSSLFQFQIHEDVPSIAAPILGSIGPFSIATSTITVMFLTVCFIALCMYIAKAKIMPSGFQTFLETLYEMAASFITSIIGDKDRARQVVPYVGAILLYLLISNLLFMIPFLSSFYVEIGGHETPLFRGNTTDFNTTFGLALAVIVIMQIVGIKEQGFFHYFGHFIQIKPVITGFRKGVKEGGIAIISFFVGLIEIVSEITKIMSLSLRLFGNMFAHEVLTVILLGAFSFVVPVIWMGMGLLVGVVQSIVFVSLVSVYYALLFIKDPEL